MIMGYLILPLLYTIHQFQQVIAQDSQATPNSATIVRDFNSTLWLKGQGAIDFMSSQQEILVQWKLASQNDSIVMINSINCLVTNKKIFVKANTYLPIKLITEPVQYKQDTILVYTFLADTFAPGSNVLVDCLSNITVQQSNNSNKKEYIQKTTASVKMIPVPKGTFKITPLGGKAVFIEIRNFSPYLGMSKKVFDKYLNDVIPDNNEYLILETFSHQHYLPLQYTLYANHGGELFTIWNYESNEEVIEYLNILEIDSKLSFKMNVGNQWTHQGFISDQKDLEQDKVQINKYIQQTLSTLKTNLTNQELERDLKIIMIYSHSLNTEQNQTCYCRNGDCQNQVCICQPGFIGTQCELERNSTLSYVTETFTMISSLLKSDMTFEMYRYVSSIMVDLSGIHSLSDITIVNQQISILTKMNNKKNNLDLSTANNMIKIYENTQDQLTGIFSQGSNRILNQQQLGPSRTTRSQNLSELSNDSSSKIYSVGEIKQFNLDQLFQKILVTTHKIMIRSNKYYQEIMYRNLTVVMSVLNFTQNQTSQVLNVNGVKFRVNIPTSDTIITSNSDNPAVFLLMRQLESWKNDGQVEIKNKQYIQVNIRQSKTYSALFTDLSKNTYKSSHFSIIFPKSYGQGQCVYFDLETLSWLNQTLKQSNQGSSIKCSTYHLTDFAIGQFINAKEDDGNQAGQIQFDNNQNKQQEQEQIQEENTEVKNTKIGQYNLSIVLLVYFVCLFFVCILRGIKFSQHPPHTKTMFNVVTQNDDAVLDKQGRVRLETQIFSVRQSPIPLITRTASQVIAEDQSPTKIINTDGPNNISKINELKKTRLYNFVFCLCPHPLSWIPSMHRLQLIFLWFTCYQFIFSIFTTFDYKKFELVYSLFATLAISNVLNYVYAGVALCMSKIASSHSSIITRLFINFLIMCHLLVVYVLYSNNDQEDLIQDHVLNIMFQVIINMGLFDLMMELISKYPGIGCLRRMRSFKLMEFVAE